MHLLLPAATMSHAPHRLSAARRDHLPSDTIWTPSRTQLDPSDRQTRCLPSAQISPLVPRGEPLSCSTALISAQQQLLKHPFRQRMLAGRISDSFSNRAAQHRPPAAAGCRCSVRLARRSVEASSAAALSSRGSRPPCSSSDHVLGGASCGLLGRRAMSASAAGGSGSGAAAAPPYSGSEPRTYTPPEFQQVSSEST